MVVLTQTGEMTFYEWLILLGAICTLFFFLLAEHRTLLVIRQNNRRLTPGLVWLQIIPLFGVIWQFVVVVRIADSLRKENISRLEESLMSNSASSPLAASKYPTLGIGLSYCILALIYWIIVVYAFLRPAATSISIARVYQPGIEFYLTTIGPVVSILGSLFCWILYWMGLNRMRRRLTLRAIV